MIRATYSSNVFKSNDKFYESISIDMKRENERTGFAIVLFRHIDKQCFGYDDNDVFMVTQDDWTYVEDHHHELNNITRSQITKKLNEITTWAVQKFDVDDVGEMNQHCVLLRNERGFPFNSEHSMENLLRDHCMSEFETLLHNSFGRHRTYNILRFFRKHYPELPMSMTENFEPTLKRKVEPSYETWGEWA